MTWEEKLRIIKGVCRGASPCPPLRVSSTAYVRPDEHLAVSPDQVKLANFDMAFIPNAPNLSIEKSVREHFDRRYVDPAVWLKPRDIAPASDIYSLGLVFYQLITGQPPRHDVEAVLAGEGIAIDTGLLKDELSRADSPSFIPDATGAAEVINRMCAPKRSERYSSLEDVLGDLAIVEA